MPYHEGRVWGLDNERPKRARQVLIDSGAAILVGPLAWCPKSLRDRPVEYTGASDAQDNKLNGIRGDVWVELKGLPKFEAVMWFCKSVSIPLIGQAFAFEVLGVNFQNFPGRQEGRRYALYEAPKD